MGEMLPCLRANGFRAVCSPRSCMMRLEPSDCSQHPGCHFKSPVAAAKQPRPSEGDLRTSPSLTHSLSPSSHIPPPPQGLAAQVTLSFGADATTAGNLAAALERNASVVMHVQGAQAPGYPAVATSTPRPLWVWAGQAATFPVSLWEQREQLVDTAEAQVELTMVDCGRLDDVSFANGLRAQVQSAVATVRALSLSSPPSRWCGVWRVALKGRAARARRLFPKLT